MNIAENIKRLRKAEGLTQYELVELIGQSDVSAGRYEKNARTPSLSRMTLARYEQGKTEPQLSIVEIIAHALEVSVPELLGYPPTVTIEKEKDLSQVSTKELLKELERRLV